MSLPFSARTRISFSYGICRRSNAQRFPIHVAIFGRDPIVMWLNALFLQFSLRLRAMLFEQRFDGRMFVLPYDAGAVVERGVSGCTT